MSGKKTVGLAVMKEDTDFFLIPSRDEN